MAPSGALAQSELERLMQQIPARAAIIFSLIGTFEYKYLAEETPKLMNLEGHKSAQKSLRPAVDALR